MAYANRESVKRCGNEHLLNFLLPSAAVRGDVEHIQKLCTELAELDLKNDKMLGEALCNAASEGRDKHCKVIETLIQFGADVNFIFKYGTYTKTPLLIASSKGHLEVVKILLRSSVDINQEGADNETPLSVAACNGHREIVTLLLTNGAKSLVGALFHTVVMAKFPLNIADLLLQAGASSNCSKKIKTVGASYNTPVLIMAICKADVETTRLLLKWDALVNQYVSGSFTHFFNDVYEEMHYITQADEEKRYIEIMKLLLFCGADVRKVTLTNNDAGFTAFTVATLILHNYFEYILEKGWQSENELEQFKDYVLLLHAPGVKHVGKELMASYPPGLHDSIQQILADSSLEFLLTKSDNFQRAKIKLSNLCREKIRDYLLSPTGGNNNNLVKAVPCLPLPQRLKKFLLFDSNILDSSHSFYESHYRKP